MAKCEVTRKPSPIDKVHLTLTEEEAVFVQSVLYKVAGHWPGRFTKTAITEVLRQAGITPKCQCVKVNTPHPGTMFWQEDE